MMEEDDEVFLEGEEAQEEMESNSSLSELLLLLLFNFLFLQEELLLVLPSVAGLTSWAAAGGLGEEKPVGNMNTQK